MSLMLCSHLAHLSVYIFEDGREDQTVCRRMLDVPCSSEVSALCRSQSVHVVARCSSEC